MYSILRTLIKKQILCEFVAPRHPSRKVIILAKGLPSQPRNEDVMLFLARKGYWVFLPRYRGSWESTGLFLRHAPAQDIKDVIDQLTSGFVAIDNGKRYKIANPEVYLIGNSFGGAAMLLASAHPKVKKVIALSPATDWRTLPKNEWSRRFGYISTAFGGAYRSTPAYVKKFMTGKAYNPMLKANTLPGEKILIMHPQDDRDVSYLNSVAFAYKTGCALILPKRGGHMAMSDVRKPAIWKAIRAFIKK